MIHNKFFLGIGVAAIAMTAALTSCTNDNAPNSDNPEPNKNEVPEYNATYTGLKLSSSDEEALRGYEDFIVNLKDHINLDENENYVYSPYNISSLLVMVANGTANESLKQVESVFGNVDIDMLTDMFSNISTALSETDGMSQFTTAHSIWYNNGRSINGDFKARIKDAFACQIEERDFRNPQSVIDQINDWSSEKTHGMITNIIDRLSSDVVFVNASYFKALWTCPFDKSSTTVSLFHKSNGESVETDMMRGRDIQLYGSTDKFAYTSKELGRRPFKMTFILPSENVSLSEVWSLLDKEQLHDILSVNTNKMCDVYMEIPHFKIPQQSYDLTQILHSMGISNMFDANMADFSFMTDTKFSIPALTHFSTLEVDEEGATASSVTATLVGSPGIEYERYDLIADKPFIFIISENYSDVILFMGQVTDPTRK